jgi:hypothetical protein
MWQAQVTNGSGGAGSVRGDRTRECKRFATFSLVIVPIASGRSIEVFWNRAAREARRQQVLDELIDLEPEARRARLDRAVSEGDVRTAEVDQALRIVGRLDALKVMTIPGLRAVPAAADTGSGAAVVAGLADEPAVQAIPAPRKRRSSRARRRKAVAVAVEPAAARPVAIPVAAIEPPVRHESAVETGVRIGLEREAAVRKASRAIGGGPRRSRRRGPSAEAVARAAFVAREQLKAVHAPETPTEEQWPSIAWLRPST